MGPRPTTPENPSRIPVCTRVLSSPTGRPSTPPRVSVGVSPIRVQRTPSRIFISRGMSPPALIDTLPPSLASWFHSISQMETIPPWDSRPLAPAEAISVTDSENEDLSRARSPEGLPEAQNKFFTDALVCICFFFHPVVTDSTLLDTCNFVEAI
jgi:hypothetical protein